MKNAIQNAVNIEKKVTQLTYILVLSQQQTLTVNFEHISHLFLKFLLLTLNK